MSCHTLGKGPDFPSPSRGGQVGMGRIEIVRKHLQPTLTLVLSLRERKKLYPYY